MVLAALQADRQARHAQVPEALQGGTFVYSRLDQQWVLDESRSDAPADAVRVMWYELDGAGELAVPLVEMGPMDLTAAGGELDRLGVRVVDDQLGVVLDFTQGYSESVSGTGTLERFAADGSFAELCVQPLGPAVVAGPLGGLGLPDHRVVLRDGFG